MSGRYAYSLDRESFLGAFQTRAEALKAAMSAARQQAEPPTEVYVGLKHLGDAQVTGHAQHVIERMADRANAANDGAAKYLQSVGEQEEAELDSMLSQTITQWLTKHNCMPEFFRVEAISEHPVPNPPRRANGQAQNEVSEIGTSDLP